MNNQSALPLCAPVTRRSLFTCSVYSMPDRSCSILARKFIWWSHF